MNNFSCHNYEFRVLRKKLKDMVLKHIASSSEPLTEMLLSEKGSFKVD